MDVNSMVFLPDLSPIQAQSNYIKALFSFTSNPTALLLDNQTMNYLSVIASQTEILKNNVLLVDKLENDIREKNINLDCIVLCRCTKANIEYIRREISSPKYGEYIIIFTSSVSQQELEDIAQADKKEIVKKVFEFYLDYLALDEYLFSLDIPSIVPILNYGIDDSNYFRMVEGLTAAILSFQKMPTIYYHENSDICKKLADSIRKECIDNQERYEFLQKSNRKDKKNTVLLIMDRRDDPITPLLTQWTYQAMVHENLGQNNGGIILNRIKLEDSTTPEVVLSSKDDEFFKNNMLRNWGDLCLNIKEMVDAYKQKANVRDDIKSIDDIRSFINNYPQVKQFMNQVEKHFSVVQCLRDTITERNLLHISKLEQEIACSYHPKDHFKELQKIITDPHTTKRDIIRLSILYALKYESYNKNANVDQLELILTDHCNLKPKEVSLIRAAQEFAGEQKRPQIKSGETGLLNNLKKLHKIVGLNDVENVFTQHKPLISSLVTQIFSQQPTKPKDGSSSRYGSYVQVSKSQPQKNDPDELIIFIIGGATYEESLFVHEWNNNPSNGGKKVTLGGTSIINSKAFLKEIQKFMKSDSIL